MENKVSRVYAKKKKYLVSIRLHIPELGTKEENGNEEGKSK